MPDVLSQNEIDSLLQALSTGELDMDEMQNSNEVKISNYDFKRPAKFSKDHLRTLEIVFEHYARLLSTNLPVYLRKNIQVDVTSSETVTFSEFSNALSNPVILGVINFDPLPGNLIMELSTNLGYAMIDRMLGGPGKSVSKKRDFSEIELSIVEKMLVICTQLLREPWKNVLDAHPMLDRIETNAQFAQIVSPSDMIAIVTLNIRLGEEEGLMNICLPYFTVESVMDKLNTKYWFSTMQEVEDEDYQDHITSVLRKVDIPIRAVLGESSITVSDFLGLQRGDIIRLNSRVDDEMEIYVGNIKKFTALPGASKDAYAVRVTSVKREGD